MKRRKQVISNNVPGHKQVTLAASIPMLVLLSSENNPKQSVLPSTPRQNLQACMQHTDCITNHLDLNFLVSYFFALYLNSYTSSLVIHGQSLLLHKADVEFYCRFDIEEVSIFKPIRGSVLQTQFFSIMTFQNSFL